MFSQAYEIAAQFRLAALNLRFIDCRVGLVYETNPTHSIFIDVILSLRRTPDA
jgi:hypothetical protein